MICEEVFQEETFVVEQPSVPNDLVIFGELNKAKYSVVGAFSPSLNMKFAVKMFPFVHNQVNPHFVKEAAFMPLKHENIISILDCRVQQVVPVQNALVHISCIVMELAPFGDFFDLIITKKIKFDEKMARTYFHQLLNGVEYIHENGAAHLDLKLENLLLSEDFSLKITDFDTAHINGQEPVTSRGTNSYRAPEILARNCRNAQAADVYSMGVLLFAFLCGGKLPYKEQSIGKENDFFSLMTNNKTLFWEKHCEMQRREQAFFSQDFKSLFESLVEVNPKKRATISDIKNSNWFNQPIYSQEALQQIMSKNLL